MLHDLALVTPHLILLCAALFTLVADPFLPSDMARKFWGLFGAGMSALAVVACALLWKYGPFDMQTPAFSYHLSACGHSLFFTALVALCAMVTHLASPQYLVEQEAHYGEYYALLHFATFGMAIMVSSESLLSLFIGLEIMSMAIYVLVAFKRTSPASVEAGMKYFIMGSVASAFLLYGIAFLFGLSGGTSFVEIQRALLSPKPGQDLWLGLAVVLTGGAFLFKVAAVPFHMWTPDVYEGAPTPITGFMSSAVKAAAFATFLKFLYAGISGPAFAALHLPMAEILGCLAVITMTVGNILALTQRSLKRMLAYSAVAHAGYLLLGTIATIDDPTLGAPFLAPTGAVPFYLVGYALASLAGFAALASLGKDGEELTTEGHLAGLSKRHPIAALTLTVSVLSLAGVPPTLGFFGKLQILRDVLHVQDGKYLPHVIILVLNSVVSAYYYLKIPVAIYMRPDSKADREYVRDASLTWAMALPAAALLLIGIMPGRAMDWASRSEAGIRPATAAANTAHSFAVVQGGGSAKPVVEKVQIAAEKPAVAAARAAAMPAR
jgi:NADH-quinone oxidoreductase subunit N